MCSTNAVHHQVLEMEALLEHTFEIINIRSNKSIKNSQLLMVGSYDIVDLKGNKQVYGILTKSLGNYNFYLMRDGGKEGEH